MTRTEKEKMIAGEYYNASDPELVEARRQARLLLKQFNDSGVDERAMRNSLLSSLVPAQGTALYIEPPFSCDYGTNITLGDRVYMNFGCIILDVAPVRIGSDVLFGPQVQVYTATHPVDWQERASGVEYGKPITIGSNVWIGGGAILCPGVSIGDRSIIGAGSVVTRDIPAGVLAAGNPCRVIKML